MTLGGQETLGAFEFILGAQKTLRKPCTILITSTDGFCSFIACWGTWVPVALHKNRQLYSMGLWVLYRPLYDSVVLHGSLWVLHGTPWVLRGTPRVSAGTPRDSAGTPRDSGGSAGIRGGPRVSAYKLVTPGYTHKTD